MTLAIRKAIAGGLLTLSVAALSACGGSGTSGGAAGASLRSGGKVVDIYSSFPMRGPWATQSAALVEGMRLALAQAGYRAGPFSVQYTALDDSGGPGGWDADQTAANARKAAGDPHAVYYVGEFDDDASKVSMPILNEAGISQVSPANTYVGLTTSAPGEPQANSPTDARTFLRIVPSDSVQAAAILLAMSEVGCTRSAVVDDQEPYGTGLAALIGAEKALYSMNVVSVTGVDPNPRARRAYATSVRAQRPDCFVLAGVASPSLVKLTAALHAARPTAKIFAPGAMCSGSWTNPKDGGVAPSVGRMIECTAITRPVRAYPGGKAFLAAYRARYGAARPSPYAILGYEAMKLGLSTVAGLGAGGDGKSAVRTALFSISRRRSVLGTYGFDKNGDTTLRSYGLYKVGPGGDPVFVRTITPPRVL